MALQLWVDDSGSKGDGGWFAFAGLLADAATWDAFSQGWASTLSDDPAIEYFKAQEAATRKGEFEHWSDGRIDLKVRDLVRHINDAAPMLVCTGREVHTFQTLSVGKLPAPANQPYFFGFYEVIGLACRHLMRLGHTEPFEIIFDEHVSTGRKTRDFYDFMLECVSSEARRILPNDVIFRDDKKFLPLQAADLFAWVSRRGQGGGEHPFAWLHDALPNMRGSETDMGTIQSPMAQKATEQARSKPLTSPHDVVIEVLRGYGLQV